jgi:hypothetical protein
MAAILEIPALNPISPYFSGGIGKIRKFAVRAFCSEAELVRIRKMQDSKPLYQQPWETIHGIRAFSHAEWLSGQIRGLS